MKSEKFGEKLRSFTRVHGDVTDLAKAIGVTPKQITRWRQGAVPPVETLIELSNYYKYDFFTVFSVMNEDIKEHLIFAEARINVLTTSVVGLISSTQNRTNALVDAEVAQAIAIEIEKVRAAWSKKKQ